MRRWGRLAMAAVIVLSGLAGAAGAAGTEAPVSRQTATGPGPQVAAFTSGTGAATGAAVDQGMWTAAFERADRSERARMLRERAARLERRMDALERDRAAMNDTAGAAAAARRAALENRASALAAASADTAAVAERRGQSDTAAALRGLQGRAERLDREMSAGPADDPGRTSGASAGSPDGAGPNPGGSAGNSGEATADGPAGTTDEDRTDRGDEEPRDAGERG